MRIYYCVNLYASIMVLFLGLLEKETAVRSAGEEETIPSDAPRTVTGIILLITEPNLGTVVPMQTVVVAAVDSVTETINKVVVETDFAVLIGI